MKFRTSLRYRVTLSFALLGLFVSMGLAGFLYFLTIDMEERLVAATLSAELEDYITRFKDDPYTSKPASTTIRTYVFESGETKLAPEVLMDLQPGLHSVQLDGRDYYAEIRISDNRHFAVLYDSSQIRHRENQFKLYLGIGVLVMTLLSAVLGLWLAGRVVAPVGELVSRVAQLLPENHPATLAKDFSNDEVGVLAREFDAYLQRLAEFIEREKFFTADVSHELRTPLTVIEGATAVLLEDSTLEEPQHTRVRRIARSAREISELVTALLLLAREENDTDASDCAVHEVLPQTVEALQ
ncbi:sensor histidine kinase, partial [Kaarinaea lacus]